MNTNSTIREFHKYKYFINQSLDIFNIISSRIEINFKNNKQIFYLENLKFLVRSWNIINVLFWMRKKNASTTNINTIPYNFSSTKTSKSNPFLPSLLLPLLHCFWIAPLLCSGLRVPRRSAQFGVGTEPCGRSCSIRWVVE